MSLTQSSTQSLTKEVAENITALLLIADPGQRTVQFLQHWPRETFALLSDTVSFESFQQVFALDEQAGKYFDHSQSARPPFSFDFTFTDKANTQHKYHGEVRSSGNLWVITGSKLAHLKPALAPVIQSSLADDFAYIASHDMQEPVRKLSTYVERLIEKLPEEQRQTVSPYTDRIVKSAEHLRSMIDGLLEFSRAGRDNRFEEVQLNSIAEAAVNENKKLQDETTAEITVGKLPAILANKSEMRQLFSHLVNNALKFNEGKPVVHIFERAVDETVAASLNLGASCCCIIVKDNGIGFKQEYDDKIFELFRRIHPKIKYTGNGLGLAICRKIVQHHNGVIKAYSEENKGTEIQIFLPVKQAGHA